MPRGRGEVSVKCDELGKDTVAIRVEDNGPRLPPEVLRNPRAGLSIGKVDGTGIGLPLVYETVESLGGTVTCESSERGTRFTLPRARV